MLTLMCAPRVQHHDKVLLADQPTKQFVRPEDLAAMVLHLHPPHS
jgi:hypothetical protein